MISMKGRVILLEMHDGLKFKIVILVSLVETLSEMVMQYGYLPQRIITVHASPLNLVFIREQIYSFVLKKVQCLSDQ